MEICWIIMVIPKFNRMHLYKQEAEGDKTTQREEGDVQIELREICSCWL